MTKTTLLLLTLTIACTPHAAAMENKETTLTTRVPEFIKYHSCIKVAEQTPVSLPCQKCYAMSGFIDEGKKFCAEACRCGTYSKFLVYDTTTWQKELQLLTSTDKQHGIYHGQIIDYHRKHSCLSRLVGWQDRTKNLTETYHFLPPTDGAFWQEITWKDTHGRACSTPEEFKFAVLQSYSMTVVDGTAFLFCFLATKEDCVKRYCGPLMGQASNDLNLYVISIPLLKMKNSHDPLPIKDIECIASYKDISPENIQIKATTKENGKIAIVVFSDRCHDAYEFTPNGGRGQKFALLHNLYFNFRNKQ